MLIRTKLIILGLNSSTSEYYYVNDDGFPSRTVFIPNLRDGVKSIYEKYLDTDPQWINTYLVDVKDGDGCIDIYYSCLIPLIISLKQGEWKNVSQVSEEDKEIVLQAIRKQTG